VALLRESPDDLVALAGAAADSLGLPEPSFVEKDYWVVELLRSVMRPLILDPINGKLCSARPLFKGGTSLSKVFGLVDRFSEDVDILISHENLGQAARENRVLRPICIRAQADLGLPEEAVRQLEQSTGVKRNVAYRYPQRIPSPIINPEAKLEMGIRGGTIPGTVQASVSSFIAQYISAERIDAEFDDLAPVEVEAIAPVRTLVEKLALLHHAAKNALAGQPRSLELGGRHYYDIARLLGSDQVLKVLSGGASIQEIAGDVDEWSQRSGWSYTARPVEGYGSSAAFMADSPIRTIAGASYLDAQGLMWGDIPTFDECLEVVRANAHLL
jgi:hypothetical protein